MKTLLFVILPYPSHYMVCFPLAKEFQKKGFKIIFTGNQESLGELVEQNGFDYIPMKYQIDESVPNIKIFFSLIILSILSKKFYFERYKEFYFNILEVKRLILQTQTDTIFIDEHLSYYYFYFIVEKCKIFFINTKLLTSVNLYNPPLNTPYFPSTTFAFQVFNKFLWFKVWLNHLIISLRYKLAFAGKDENFFIKRFCIKNNINYNTLINRKNVFYYGVKKVQTIILAPENLDLACNNKDSFYLWLKDKRNENRFFNKNYIDLTDIINNNIFSKVILCSFGTLIDEYDKVVFLNNLNIAIQNDSYLLIVVSKDLNCIRNKSKNVFIFSSVPQLDLLKYCDLMIHHGGFNTIKECLQFQVPMLIYALNKKNYDWIGNTARVKWKGLGIVGNIYKDNPIKIKENIKKALEIKIPKYDFDKEYVKLEKFIKEELLYPYDTDTIPTPVNGKNGAPTP